MASRTDASGGDAMAKWLSGWTVFYWAWWISWTPFVGMFIARISRGRTIRQFVTGVLLVPSMVSLVWFAIFGGAAIDAQRAAAATATTADDLVAKVGGVASVNFDGVLFQLLDAVPAGQRHHGPGHGPGRHLLRLRRGRRLDRDGHAVGARARSSPRAAPSSSGAC